MGFWSIVQATGLAPVEVWLGLLLGAGASMERSGDGDDEGFYRRDGILVLGGINRIGTIPHQERSIN
jgi:hypothetical protein